MNGALFFQQLFECESFTYTYVLADMQEREAVIIDPVLETVERDLQLLRDLDLKLKYILETHVHADHITGAGRLADATGAKIAMGAEAKAQGADRLLQDGETMEFGKFNIKAITCAGHTASCMCYVIDGKVFTGDALLIRGNGRTDFQEGSAENLFHNVHSKLFTLPDETLVYPAHDYKGFTSSTIGIEKQFNPRLGAGRTLTDFVSTMNNLNLAYPKKIDVALPANLKCGR